MFDQFADMVTGIDHFLENYDYDYSNNVNEVNHDGLDAIDFYIAVTCSAFSVIFLLLNGILCNGVTRVIFACKAMALLVNAAVRFAHHGESNASMSHSTNFTKLSTGLIVEVDIEFKNSPVHKSIHITTLHFHHLLSLVFFHQVYCCTCTPEKLESSMIALAVKIALSAIFSLFISGLESLSLVTIANHSLNLRTIFQSVYSPLYGAIMALETAAVFFFATHILRALNSSRNFRKQSGAKTDRGLLRLMYLIISLTISSCLQLLFIVTAFALTFLVFKQLPNVGNCMQQQFQEWWVPTTVLEPSLNSCITFIVPKRVITEAVYFILFFEFFFLFSFKLNERLCAKKIRGIS